MLRDVLYRESRLSHTDKDGNGSVTKEEIIKGSMDLLSFMKNRANKRAQAKVAMLVQDLDVAESRVDTLAAQVRTQNITFNFMTINKSYKYRTIESSMNTKI